MPTPAVKVLAVEISGVELDDQTEFNLTASVIPFTAAGYSSDNVKDAIVESRKDIHGAQYIVDLSETVTVESKKQMRTFYQQFVTGNMIIDGWLVVD